MAAIKVLKGSFNDQNGVLAKTVVITALPAPENMTELTALYHSALEKAESEHVSTMLFPSIPLTEPKSVMFQAISMIYKTMKDFQASHPYPKEIQIFCEDDSVFQLYMVVWNLYYAESKDSRMNDGRWE